MGGACPATLSLCLIFLAMMAQGKVAPTGVWRLTYFISIYSDGVGTLYLPIMYIMLILLLSMTVKGW